jgi:flavodoxin
MKIGIIFFSNTGHTAKLAETIRKRLDEEHQIVELHSLEIVGVTNPTAVSVELKSAASIEGYDAVLIGIPVWGGRPPIAMTTYLDRIDSFEGTRVGCFATHFFIPTWGGNQALHSLKDICEAKGAEVVYSGSVRWPSFRRKKKIENVNSEIFAIIGKNIEDKTLK